MAKRIAALGLALAVGAGCDDRIVQPAVVQFLHDKPVVAGDGGHVVPSPECTGRCCPDPKTAPECYLNGKNPSDYSGAECLAQRDNTGADHWQLRQTMSISTAPPGNADSTLGGVLILRSELHSATCQTNDGAGGFIQLVDFDKKNNVAYTGFAAFVKEQSDALAQGLCFVEDTYRDDAMQLPELYAPPPGWPDGLPAPQPLPWKVAPVKAYRYTDDFDVKTERVDILKRLAPGSGDLAQQGFSGVFYLDEARGLMHGYAPLGYVVTYDDATHYNAVPIREAEIRSQINDPAHPNCSGVYGANPALPAKCSSSVGTPAWSCPPEDCANGELAPTKVEGYFLQVEAEQVNIKLIGQTLCFRFPTAGYPGWTLDKTCRSGAQWNPKDPVNGIPPGDWCATTNAPATKDCHDAWHSVSYSAFQAFPIQTGKTCPAI